MREGERVVGSGGRERRVRGEKYGVKGGRESMLRGLRGRRKRRG